VRADQLSAALPQRESNKMERQPAESNATLSRTERFANLLMLSNEPMLAWALDGPIEFWNAGAERLYGFASNEAIGRSSHELLKTKFPIEFIDLLTQLRSQRYWSGELQHLCKNGREVIVDSRMQLLGDGTVLEVNRDVTEIKALARQQTMLVKDLSSAALKFKALFNQSGIFAGIVDLQGYLRDANDLSVDWCGYTRDQVLDRPFWDTPWWRGSEEMRARIFCYRSSCLRTCFSRRASILDGGRQRTDRRLRDASHSR
jgi:PAS domain S-box-containing protein